MTDAEMELENDAETLVPSREQGTQGDLESEVYGAELDRVQQRRPVLIAPYMKGIGEKLLKVAKKANCDTWWTYPGRGSDRFSGFKEQTHPSKAMNSMYYTGCTCGLKYIGELARNLKVRLGEHLHSSSTSTLTSHFLEYPNHAMHKPDLNGTTILACEQNTRKRKLVESLCIKFKSARLCNSGVSLELSSTWDVCLPALQEQLKKKPDTNR